VRSKSNLGLGKLQILIVFAICLINRQPVNASNFTLTRPNVLNLDPGSPKMSEYGRVIFKAQLVFVAKILELYPTQEIIFLARDAEYLYDLAMLANQEDPKSGRFHLVNVSRANMNDDLLKSYLAQFGLTRDALAKKKEFVFVDTGLRGTIPDRIIQLLGREYSRQMRTHLITSENHGNPSARSFMYFFDRRASEVTPDHMYKILTDYENLPKFYGQSNQFKLIDEKIVPIDTKKFNEPLVQPNLALHLMREFKLHWQSPDSQMFFGNLRLVIRQMIKEFKNGTPMSARTYFDEAKNLINDDGLMRALIIDLYEALILGDQKLAVTLKDFNIKTDSLYNYLEFKLRAQRSGVSIPSKDQAKEVFQAWIEQSKWGNIQSIINGNFEVEIYKMLAESFFAANPNPVVVHQLRYLIRRNKFFVNKLIVEELLPKTRLDIYDRILGDLIQSRNWIVLDLLIKNYFGKRLNSVHEPHLLEILEIRDQGLSETIMEEVLLKPEGLKFKESLRIFIMHSNPNLIKNFIQLAEANQVLGRPELSGAVIWILDWSTVSNRALLIERLLKRDFHSLSEEVQKRLRGAQLNPSRLDIPLALSRMPTRSCRKIFSAPH